MACDCLRETGANVVDVNAVIPASAGVAWTIWLKASNLASVLGFLFYIADSMKYAIRKRKTPRAWAHRGYSLTCSNPATNSAPCIYSLISVLYPSAQSFHRHPSGVHDHPDLLTILVSSHHLFPERCPWHHPDAKSFTSSRGCPLSFLCRYHPSNDWVLSMSVLLSVPITLPE